MYQYNKLTNDIVVRDYSKDKVKPIPHLFLSETISERIKADIMNGRLLTEQNSIKISEFIKDGVEDNKKTKTEITFDKDQDIVLRSIYSVNNIITHSLIIDDYKTDIEFNESLLSIPTHVSVVELK